jgi:ribosomal protein S12 methylthiotransferase
MIKFLANDRSDMSENISTSPVSVGFISLGCAKNLVDSQVMAGTLLKNSIILAPSPEEADVVIVNTCAFIEDAREESIDSILSACEMKKEYGVKAVVVAGCMSQRYNDELSGSLPEVDAFIGLDELDKVADIVNRVNTGETGLSDISAVSHKLYDPGLYDVVFSGGPNAYVKIAEGCDHRCAFCAIPGIRGVHRSRSVISITDEAKKLLDSGYRELDLISQDTTFYGRDRDDGASLPDLLYALGKLDGDFWIRLLYGYPPGISDELLKAMAEIPQVCNYFDIPIQHSHPDILKAMLRANTVEPVMTMAQRIRAVMPDATLRTTCLVGFPGETDEHFEHLLNFIKVTEFDHLGVFTFSPEEDTPAYDMKNCPAPEVAEERRDILMTVQRGILDKRAVALLGTETTALLESAVEGEPDMWFARTRRLAPEVDGAVIVSGVSEDAVAGSFVPIRYTGQEEYDMYGEIV